jgi:hypothetical protein
MNRSTLKARITEYLSAVKVILPSVVELLAEVSVSDVGAILKPSRVWPILNWTMPFTDGREGSLMNLLHVTLALRGPFETKALS